MPDAKPQLETDTREEDDDLVLDHARVSRVDPDIFRFSFVGDCTQHRCLCRDQGNRPRPDACCQYGADVLPHEKRAILRRASEVASVLEPTWRSSDRWFDERDPEPVPGDPSVMTIRTAITDLEVEDSGCVFLEQVGGARGCGLHLAALKHGFDPAEIKPSVCRLYPLSLEDGHLGISPDFDQYSCANSGTQSIYAVMRGVLAQMFDEDLLAALDDLARATGPAGDAAADSAPLLQLLPPPSKKLRPPARAAGSVPEMERAADVEQRDRVERAVVVAVGAGRDSG